MMKSLVIALAAASTLASATTARALTCAGTEPFWTVKIADGKIVFSEPGAEPRRLATVAAERAQGRPIDLLRVYRTQTIAGPHEPATIVVRRAPGDNCNDGMSDNTYPYIAVVIIGSRILEGCCRW